VLAGLLCLASFARAEVLPLPALLEHAVLGASVRAADADLAALEALKQQREAEAGWQWFASASTGRYRELVTEDLIDDYYGRNLALGLRHPLLGSLHRQLALVRNVDSELQQQQARRELYRLEQRLALRSAYADWWRAQQEQHWCRAFAGTAEQARRHLAERLRDGWLLASEAGLLDARGKPCSAPVPEIRSSSMKPARAWSDCPARRSGRSRRPGPKRSSSRCRPSRSGARRSKPTLG